MLAVRDELSASLSVEFAVKPDDETKLLVRRSVIDEKSATKNKKLPGRLSAGALLPPRLPPAWIAVDLGDG